MKFSLACLLVCAMLVVVYSTHCHKDDTSTCTGVTCTNAGEEVGCDHDQCTCVKSQVTTTATPCRDRNECPKDIRCHGHGPAHGPGHDHADELQHCVDGTCQCI